MPHRGGWKGRQFARALFRRRPLSFIPISAPFTLLGFLEKVARSTGRAGAAGGKKPGLKERKRTKGVGGGGTRGNSRHSLCFVQRGRTRGGAALRRAGKWMSATSTTPGLHQEIPFIYHPPTLPPPPPSALSVSPCFLSRAFALRSVPLRMEACFESVAFRSIETARLPRFRYNGQRLVTKVALAVFRGSNEDWYSFAGHFSMNLSTRMIRVVNIKTEDVCVWVRFELGLDMLHVHERWIAILVKRSFVFSSSFHTCPARRFTFQKKQTSRAIDLHAAILYSPNLFGTRSVC